MPTASATNAASADDLRAIAYTLREHIVRMCADSPGAHLGGSMSSVEILTVLLFDGVVRVDPSNPKWEDRDYFIFSKGHSSASLYAAMAERGFFPVEELKEYKKTGGRLAGHPSKAIPGIELATGSLGHGLGVGNGIALAAKHDGEDRRVYVVLGDGECQEGSIWEAAMTAAHYKLDNVVAIVDRNFVQEDGKTEDIMSLEPFAEKWRAFGWDAREIDGHDVEALSSALHDIPFTSGKPSVIIAQTVKGKSISYAEGNHAWHYGKMNAEQREQAFKDLEAIRPRSAS